VDLDEESTKSLRDKWKKFAGDIELVVLASPYRALTRPLLRYINRVERDHKDDLDDSLARVRTRTVVAAPASQSKFSDAQSCAPF
jgi:hypothetical protein